MQAIARAANRHSAELFAHADRGGVAFFTNGRYIIKPERAGLAKKQGASSCCVAFVSVSLIDRVSYIPDSVKPLADADAAIADNFAARQGADEIRIYGIILFGCADEFYCGVFFFHIRI